MKLSGLSAIGLAVVISSGCAANFSHDAANGEPAPPNMTANLELGVSSDSILSNYGKPLQKKGRMASDGRKLEDWFYTDAILSFKDGNLDAFRPR